MTSIRSYRRSVLDWLRAEYGVRDAWVDPTGRHSRVRFTYLGREHAFPLNDRNAAGGSNAVDLKFQDIRRELGPPPSPSATAPKRTLQEMTMTLEAKAPFNPLPFAPALDSRASDYPCTVALYPSSRCLAVTLPRELLDAFGPGRCAVGFTAPDLITIRHSSPTGGLPRFNARGHIAVGAAGILGRIGFGFATTPCRASLVGDAVEVRLDFATVERKPLATVKAAPAEPVSSAPSPSALREASAAPRTACRVALVAIAAAEATGYELKRVRRTPDAAPEWAFVAPTIYADE